MNTNIDMILHRIRVKLYPNYLKHGAGTYIARTNNEKTLSIEDVCTSMKTRGGFKGNFEELISYVREYNDEAAYLLCDGYAISNGYYTIHPNVGGCFNSVNEVIDCEKHPISFRFSARAKLRELIKHIAVDIEGIADKNGYIDTFTDYEEKSINENFIPGNLFEIHGHKIKVAGDDPSVGVYFVPVLDSSKAVKVTRLGKNTPSEITGLAPFTGNTETRIEIRTQYMGSGEKFLKSPRTIVSSFTLNVA